ncbi:MAG: alpha/beta hydrolase [Candidatus Puniceispirillaceae bacterium]
MTDPSPLAACAHPIAYLPPADLDDAYENRAYIADGDSWLQRWPRAAAAFRDSHPGASLDQPYGDGARQRFDLFCPEGGLKAAKGILGIVHGGYWMALSKDAFSHLAAGPLARGWAVAMIGYTLAPQARIAEITAEITAATNAVATLGSGPLRLAGHSAGGHLVARMMCADVALSDQAVARLDRVVSVSGLHDLRPLRQLAKNEVWKLDAVEAVAESPALSTPREGIELVCVAGAAERPEFIRQNALLPLAWQGLGVPAYSQLLAGDHHFSVIDHLAERDSPVCKLVDAPLG